MQHVRGWANTPDSRLLSSYCSPVSACFVLACFIFTLHVSYVGFRVSRDAAAYQLRFHM